MIRRRTFLAAAATALLPVRSRASATAPIPFRISSENGPDHIQTRVVARFATELSQRAGGDLTVEHRFGGRSLRDRDVVRAMAGGKLEMAVPGAWHLDRVEPSVGIFALPAFYGRETGSQDSVRDGVIGSDINRRLETALTVKVLGRWIDLGFAHLYGVERMITRHADVRELRIRVAGGEANLHRLTAMGARPRVVAWSDLPAALAEGSIDAILSTHESVASGRMWTLGIRSAFEDRQYFAQYLPLVGAAFWANLPGELRHLAASTWESQVTWARAEAAAAQNAARKTLVDNGVAITTPTAETLTAERAKLLSVQPAVVTAMGMDPKLVGAAMAVLR